LQKRFSFH